MDSSLVVKIVTRRSWVFIKQVGYYFAPSGKPYPDNWIITDVIYEFERSLLSRQVSLIFGAHLSQVPDVYVSACLLL